MIRDHLKANIIASSTAFKANRIGLGPFQLYYHWEKGRTNMDTENGSLQFTMETNAF